MLVKLIVGLARTNIIAQCAQITNMRLMATLIISALSVPMRMVPMAREKSARLAKIIAKDAKAALLATYVCTDSKYLGNGDCLDACPSGSKAAGAGITGRLCVLDSCALGFMVVPETGACEPQFPCSYLYSLYTF